MENKMALEFIGRREDFFRLRASSKKEGEVAAKRLFNWVMSTIESLYWSDDLTHIVFDVDLYAKGDEIFLVHTDKRSNKELKFNFRRGYSGRLLVVLKKFVELFNQTDYLKHNYRVSDPWFHAEGPVTCGSSEFHGNYYAVYMHIAMRTDLHYDDELRA